MSAPHQQGHQQGQKQDHQRGHQPGQQHDEQPDEQPDEQHRQQQDSQREERREEGREEGRDLRRDLGENPAPRLPQAVLIANRGEIAARIARTCRSMGIRAIGVASEVDADASHLAACDDTILIGGASPSASYLRADVLVDAAVRAGADAVHPGFGFLAESPAFAKAVLDAGLIWIGPSPEVIAAMGDKLEAKQRMAVAGVPLVPGEELPLEPTDDDIRAAGERIGLPIIVKAAAGGGGKGMRSVHHLDDLPDAVASARRESASAFGDDRVFLERLIGRPRHVEVQIVGDSHGQVLHLFERECSVQRRHQKVVEECPSPGIDAEVRGELTTAAVEAARSLGYVSAGTVEFVVDDEVLARRRAGEDVPARAAIAFLEVNTRLQVEHPVTEEVVGVRDDATGLLEPIDLVRWQLLVAGGFPLPATQDRIVARGHSIEVRLYAEDVPAGYLPATGRLAAFDVPALPGIRRELGVRAGDVVTPHYDPMLAKVIATAPTRHEAAGRLAAALAASPIAGVTTNRDLLVAVLRDDRFLAGATTTAFLADHLDELLARVRPSPMALARAAVFAAVHATLRAGMASSRGAPGGPISVPAGFSNTGVVWQQHTFLPAGLAAIGDEPGEPGEQDQPGDAAADDAPAPAAEGLATTEEGPATAEDGATDPRAIVARGGLTVRLRARRDGTYEAEVHTGVPAAFLDADGEVVHVARLRVHDHGSDHLDVEVDGHRQRVTVAGMEQAAGAGGGAAAARRQVLAPGLGIVDLDVVPRFPDREHRAVAGATRAPMPGVVVEVAVAVGEEVAEGAVLVIVEAMKMEHRVTAPRAGTVTEVRVIAGQQVDANEVLVVVGEG